MFSNMRKLGEEVDRGIDLREKGELSNMYKRRKAVRVNYS